MGLRSSVTASIDDPSERGRPGPAAPALRGTLWDLLCRQPVELYFIGASVTAQRDGWAGELMQMLRRETGHAHVERTNAMGGVGLLFGVANYTPPPPDVQPGVACIEFSTGDLTPGLTPTAELAPLLCTLLRRTTANYQATVIVHNWRADFADKDDAGVRRIYDSLAAAFSVPVIHNHVMAKQAIEGDPAIRGLWFRDVCHTNPSGAAAYACHVMEAMRTLDVTPRETPGCGSPTLVDDHAAIRFVDPFLGRSEAASTGTTAFYTYPSTGQTFQTMEFEAGCRLQLRCSGRLMGIAFITGPRAGGVELTVNGRRVRQYACFDRHSHYRRYILLPCFMSLEDAELELRCLDDLPDRSVPSGYHPDFEAPRSMTLVHLVGAGLQVARCEVLRR